MVQPGRGQRFSTEATSALTSGSGGRAPGFRRRILAALSPAFLTAAAPQEG